MIVIYFYESHVGDKSPVKVQGAVSNLYFDTAPLMVREHDEKFSMSPGEFDGFLYYDSISLPTGIAEPWEM